METDSKVGSGRGLFLGVFEPDFDETDMGDGNVEIDTLHGGRDSLTSLM